MLRGSGSCVETATNERKMSQEDIYVRNENELNEETSSLGGCSPNDETAPCGAIVSCEEHEETASCEETGISTELSVPAIHEEFKTTIQRKKQFTHLPVDSQVSFVARQSQTDTRGSDECAIHGSLIASDCEKCLSTKPLDVKQSFSSPSLISDSKSSFSKEIASLSSNLSCSTTEAQTIVESSSSTALLVPGSRLKGAGSDENCSDSAPNEEEPKPNIILRTSSVEIFRRVKPEHSSKKPKVFVIQPSFKQVLYPPSYADAEEIKTLFNEKSASKFIAKCCSEMLASSNQDFVGSAHEEEQKNEISRKESSSEGKCLSNSEPESSSKKSVPPQIRSTKTQCNLYEDNRKSSTRLKDELSQENPVKVDVTSNSESLSKEKIAILIQCSVPRKWSDSKPSCQLKARSKSQTALKSKTEHDSPRKSLSEARITPSEPDASVEKECLPVDKECLPYLSKSIRCDSNEQIIIEEKIFVNSKDPIDREMTYDNKQVLPNKSLPSSIRPSLFGTPDASSSKLNDATAVSSSGFSIFVRSEKPSFDLASAHDLPSKIGPPLLEKQRVEESEYKASSSLRRDNIRCSDTPVTRSPSPKAIFDRSKLSSGAKKSRLSPSTFEDMFCDASDDSASECWHEMLDSLEDGLDSDVSEDYCCLSDYFDEGSIGSFKGEDANVKIRESVTSRKSKSAGGKSLIPETDRDLDRVSQGRRALSQNAECGQRASKRRRDSIECDYNFSAVSHPKDDNRKRRRSSKRSNKVVSEGTFCTYALVAVDNGSNRRSRSENFLPRKELSPSRHCEERPTSRIKSGSCFCEEERPNFQADSESCPCGMPCLSPCMMFVKSSSSCSLLCESHPKPCNENRSDPRGGTESDEDSDENAGVPCKESSSQLLCETSTHSANSVLICSQPNPFKGNGRNLRGGNESDKYTGENSIHSCNVSGSPLLGHSSCFLICCEPDPCNEGGSDMFGASEPNKCTGKKSTHCCNKGGFRLRLENSTHLGSNSCFCSQCGNNTWRGKNCSDPCSRRSSHHVDSSDCQSCPEKRSCPCSERESLTCHDHIFEVNLVNECSNPCKMNDASTSIDDCRNEDESLACSQKSSCVPCPSTSQTCCENFCRLQSNDCSQPCSDDCPPPCKIDCSIPCGDDCPRPCGDDRNTQQRTSLRTCKSKECRHPEKTVSYLQCEEIDLETGHRSMRAMEVVAYNRRNPCSTCNIVATSTFIIIAAFALILSFFVGMLVWKLHSSRKERY